ncbi:MAG: hypothetical protein GY804_09395 [Alphaproteobacteria bacterium]|nr:hypothetical protein [Alphaproteobacteria bacterium]
MCLKQEGILPLINPSYDDIEAEDFNKIWDIIKNWEVKNPKNNGRFEPACGQHALQILFATGRRRIEDYIYG